MTSLMLGYYNDVMGQKEKPIKKDNSLIGIVKDNYEPTSEYDKYGTLLHHSNKTHVTTACSPIC